MKIETELLENYYFEEELEEFLAKLDLRKRKGII